jgi:hypothetical protein
MRYDCVLKCEVLPILFLTNLMHSFALMVLFTWFTGEPYDGYLTLDATENK